MPSIRRSGNGSGLARETDGDDEVPDESYSAQAPTASSNTTVFSQPQLVPDELDANRYVLEDESAWPYEEKPPKPTKAQQHTLDSYSHLPGGAHLANKLFNRPDWLKQDEVVTKLNTGQVVLVAWLAERRLTREAREQWSRSMNDRYRLGLTIANNGLLQAPLIDEGLPEYRTRQWKLVGRLSEKRSVLGREYWSWFEHPDTSLDWIPPIHRQQKYSNPKNKQRQPDKGSAVDV
ncbi:uncharacterized protein LTR77_007855 [Saxophila tyrrhenica]|uniref:Uncharacterized protein n=1 Tax=Saxophila tyrrhenica TaxID=1690608 RepID=A0AAV9P645_9PEZI|nr:hypothetical protein LTR77_007855 [Saxophila tyrrhenica]